jgi:hypothetical protein
MIGNRIVVLTTRPNLIAQEEELDVAGWKARGRDIGRNEVLCFVFSACAFKFGAFFIVDGEVSVSVVV